MKCSQIVVVLLALVLFPACRADRKYVGTWWRPMDASVLTISREGDGLVVTIRDVRAPARLRDGVLVFSLGGQKEEKIEYIESSDRLLWGPFEWERKPAR